MRTEIDVRITDEHTVTVFSSDDVEPILDRNALLRSMPQKSDWGKHVASVPNIILVKWLNEAWERGNIGLRPYSKEMDEIVARKLRDPEWAFLRVDGPRQSMGWGD